MGTPRAYLVQYKEANGKWENRTVKALGKPHEYTTLLSGLRSNAAYKVRVLVVDQDGYYWEDDAKTTHLRTECGAPGLPPQDVNIDNSSTSEIVITWKDPAPEHWLCGNVSVVLEANGKSMELKASGGRNIYRIPVAPYTRVEVQLRLKTPNNKYSQWTPKQIVTSAENAPTVVRNVQLRKTGSREVLYTWDPPEHANGIIRHFMVVYTPLEFRVSNCRKLKRIRKVVTVPSVLRSANLTGLHPYTKYNVSLSGVTVKPGPEHSTTLYTEATVPERAPENVKIGRTTGTSSSLAWSEVPCEFANGPNLFYYLELESRDMWDQKHRNRTTTASSFTYNDLVPYTRYQVKVFAQNDAGRLPHFSPLDFITAPEAPLPPTLLKAERLLEDSVSLLWNAPYPPYGLLEHYQLKFFAAKERHNITEHVIAHTNCGRKKGRTEQHCYVVNGLEPYEMYYFSLQAKNKGTAYSPYSVELEVKTKEAVPGPPVNIRLLDNTEHTIEILWDSPRKKNGILRTYEMNCILKHTFDDLPPEEWIARSATGNATEITSLYLGDLSPGSTYSVCVQASTSAGTGEAVCGNFSTKTSVPGVPGNLRSTEEAVDQLRILWHAPTVKNGALASYRVNSTLQHTFNDLDSDSWASKSAAVNASEETSLYLTELPRVPRTGSVSRPALAQALEKPCVAASVQNPLFQTLLIT
ncbi:phosphatidylinositol phosphatase PTPRQ-like [Haemaphysalis longicornis]